MVRKPDFKLIAKGKDITESIRKNLLKLNYKDDIDNKSDEINFTVQGLYKLPFGDELELYLGYVDKLYKCGTFFVQVVRQDYANFTTEIRAAAMNVTKGENSQKGKKSRNWDNTTLFTIAKKIASQNSLKTHFAAKDIPIASVLQNNVNDIDFLCDLAMKYGYIISTKNKTIAIWDKTEDVINVFEIHLNDMKNLEFTFSQRDSYDSVIVEWQDISAAESKKLKVGSGTPAFSMKIPQPKSDAEASRIAEAKLAKLKKGGVNATFSCTGRELRAGMKLVILTDGVDEEFITEEIKKEYTIKSVEHTLDNSGYMLDVEIEG